MASKVLQPQYQWLLKEPGPRILTEFLKIVGTTEYPGAANNPEIMAWAKRVGVDKVYTADSIPWCALGMAYVSLQAGWDIPINPLWAQNWVHFGTAVDGGKEMLGDVLVFGRKGGGHVGEYVGEDSTHFHVLGCNQSDSTNIRRKPKDQLIQARRCKWRVNQPPNVRKIFLSSTGTISTKED